ncbi:SUF system NifU family Fe-S cluster assembly protein [Candidatus Woesearchaeota archaeon]|nr:SUF system NifU family Fe-S cluster assembly protein [Candidatus Woesearchaeota archaeon]
MANAAASDGIENLYREELMDHYQNPRNFGNMADADVSYHDYNPVCGDEVTVQLKMENGTVKEAMFNGKGCAISQAAASMLTEQIHGKSVKAVVAMTQNDMLEITKINPGPVRIKCALLALRAVQKGIIQYEANRANLAK